MFACRLIDLLRIVSCWEWSETIRNTFEITSRLHYTTTIIITIINHYSFCWKGKRVRREFPLAAPLFGVCIRYNTTFDFTQLTKEFESERESAKQTNEQANQPTGSDYNPITLSLVNPLIWIAYFTSVREFVQVSERASATVTISMNKWLLLWNDSVWIVCTKWTQWCIFMS